MLKLFTKEINSGAALFITEGSNLSKRFFFKMHKTGNVGLKGFRRGKQKKVTSSEDITGDLCYSSLMLSPLSQIGTY